MNKLNLFVYGTFDGKNEHIKHLCRSLGQIFYEKGHSISIISTNEKTVDRYFIEGIRNVKRKNISINIFRDKRNTRIDRNLLNTIPYNFVGTDTDIIKNAHAQAINEADVVFTLSGNQEDSDIGVLVEYLKKPIIVINSFEGTSKELFNRIDIFYKEFFKKSEYELLNNEIFEDHNQHNILIEMIEKISKSNLFVRTVKPKAFYFILLMLIWIALYFAPDILQIKNNLALITVFLLSTSCGIGVLARNYYSIKKRKRTDIETMRLMPAGIILTFSYVLIFFSTWTTISGNDPTFLVSSNDYMKLGIAGSVSIFSASFFLEKSVLYIINVLKS